MKYDGDDFYLWQREKKTHINGMSAIISFTYSKDRKGHGQRDESDVRAGYVIW